MSDDFNEWWKNYCKMSSLNKEYLSFLDVDILKDEMKLAFYHKFPDTGNQLDKKEQDDE